VSHSAQPEESSQHSKRFWKGISYFLVAWLLFTVMTLIARPASKKVSLGTILFFQNLIGFATVLPWLGKHGWELVQTKRFGLIFFRTMVSLVAIFLSFLAVQRTSLVDTMLFNNASPLWIPFVVLIWLKIPIQHKMWPGILAGFIGIILVLQPGKGIIQIGALFAIGAGLLQSLNMVSLRLLSYTERNHTVMFYYFLICALVCAPFLFTSWPKGWILWGEVIAIGICFTLGQWAFVRAFHFAKATQLGPFCYVAVVYSVLLDWAIYGQMPDFLGWIGISLICAGGVWTIRFGRAAS
jgi:drug/metabolite transporter (DMT)-like permease